MTVRSIVHIFGYNITVSKTSTVSEVNDMFSFFGNLFAINGDGRRDISEQSADTAMLFSIINDGEDEFDVDDSDYDTDDF